jgi:hypothetical protein
MKKINYIYTLSDPRDGSVRYVGKTIEPKVRFKHHRTNKTRVRFFNSKLDLWLRELQASSIVPIFSIVEECTDNWQERERHWISEFRDSGQPILNIHPGGFSGPSGASKSEETKRRLRESNLVAWQNDELRARHSRIMSEQVKDWWKTVTPERREELRAAYRKRRHRGIGQLSAEQRSILSSRAARAQWANLTADQRRAYYHKIHPTVSTHAS